MHPGFIGWWKSRGDFDGFGPAEHAHCGARAEGPHGHHRHHHRHEHVQSAQGFEDDSGGSFGVRRPLRFLAFKLDLDETQVGEFASILDQLKIERAQSAVDSRRRVSAIADALEGATFDTTKAKEAGQVHVQSAERLKSAVEVALERMHKTLNDAQRKKLAYLLRTGALSI